MEEHGAVKTNGHAFMNNFETNYFKNKWLVILNVCSILIDKIIFKRFFYTEAEARE